MLEVRRLSKRYVLAGREVSVLDSLDLQVAAGEFVAIRGASGSGKSTLLHVLGCLDRPSGGEYRFAGQPMQTLDDDALSAFRANDVGFVFQSFHLLPELTARENVTLPFLYRGGVAAADGDFERAVSDALAQVGLSERADHLPAQLSGGEMQRVAIARAVVKRPRLLLADEPTGNLDSATGREILDLLAGLNRDGTTLILVTHDASVADRADRQLLLRDGRFDV
jgi:predicted ABC-type transport system involved in lysophospholipase L1 biosynthesis ATPase subunit